MYMKKTLLTVIALSAAALAAHAAQERLPRRPVPSAALKARIDARLDLIGIVHWGLNTFTDREWGFGDEDPALLDPKRFDADQIVRACKDGGLMGLVVVAKHHDGFCLWPTKTTEHNITKSPFRGGKGDYVREMADACRRAGLKFGVYISPWDRNNAHYGTPKYAEEVFRGQIRELLGGAYGEVFEMWFDGANGGNGWYGGSRETRRIPVGYYRYDEVYRLVRSLQPGICIFGDRDDGSDYRWPGNERGELDPDSRATITFAEYTPNGAYGNPDYHYQINTGMPGGRYFRMCEADFPLRRGWFYHDAEKKEVKSAAYLMNRYLASIGNGGTMNIGIAPNREGRVADEDVRALKGFKTLLDAFFANEVTEEGAPFNVIELSEDLANGEQVDRWRFMVDDLNLACGRAIGARRIRVLDRVVTSKNVRLEVLVHGGALLPVKMRRFLVDEELIRLVTRATATSGETDTARWMTGAAEEKKTATNSALEPRAKLEEDSYDWYERHAAVLKREAELAATLKPGEGTVFIGDSITHFWAGRYTTGGADASARWKAAFGTGTLNAGFGWDRIQNVLWRLDHGLLDKMRPRNIVVLIGTNNIGGTPNARANTPEEIAEGVKAVCARLRKKSPASRILLVNILPRGERPDEVWRRVGRAANARLKDWAAGEKNLKFVELYDVFLKPDGRLPREMMFDFTHPTDAGYAILADALKPLL